MGSDRNEELYFIATNKKLSTLLSEIGGLLKENNGIAFKRLAPGLVNIDREINVEDMEKSVLPFEMQAAA